MITKQLVKDGVAVIAAIRQDGAKRIARILNARKEPVALAIETTRGIFRDTVTNEEYKLV